MLLKFAAPLLLFLSSAFDTANNASYENTSDKERYVFPIPHVNFPFETILNLHSIFFLKGLLLLICLSFFSASTCKEIFDRNV